MQELETVEEVEGLHSLSHITEPHELTQSWSSHNPVWPTTAVQSFADGQLLPPGDLGEPVVHGAFPAFGCWNKLN